MIIDAIDLKLIRQLDLQGSIAINEIAGKFHIDRDEILLRIRNMEEAGLISGYGAKLFVPGLVGGHWYLGCALTETTQLRSLESVPHLVEVTETVVFPKGVCPNVSLVFWSRDLKASYRTINRLPFVQYVEIFKVGEYNVPLPRMLLDDERALIAKTLRQHLSYDMIHRVIFEPEGEDEVLLSRLYWHDRNRNGIISFYPNVNWQVVKNYLHLHVALTSRLRGKEMRRLSAGLTCSGTITSRFKRRYHQMEFDLWGFSDMGAALAGLLGSKGVNVEGISLAFRNEIKDEWIGSFLESLA